MSQTQLGIFAKYWQPGAVKTRLARSIGDEAAASLHRHFVQTLLHRFADAADRQLLCYTPVDARDRFLDLDLGRWELVPQSEGDLGTRMKGYFVSSLASPTDQPSPQIVLIGSDSPDLPQEYLKQALERLNEFPVVLGPTVDGGYYLLGITSAPPPIFDDIPWSTPNVWPQTIARLEAAGIRYHVLPRWYDVDDEIGLFALRQNVNMEGYMDSELRRLEDVIFDALRSQPPAPNP